MLMNLNLLHFTVIYLESKLIRLTQKRKIQILKKQRISIIYIDLLNLLRDFLDIEKIKMEQFISDFFLMSRRLINFLILPIY